MILYDSMQLRIRYYNIENVAMCRMMQALVDKLVPLLLQQMVQGYDEWVQKQTYHLNQSSSEGNFVVETTEGGRTF